MTMTTRNDGPAREAAPEYVQQQQQQQQQGEAGLMKAAAPATRGQLVRREARGAFLERRIKPEVIAQLNEAHTMFFGALIATDMTVPERTLLTSAAVVELRRLLDGPILGQVIMPLMNSPIGFDTDKNPAKGWNGPGYPKEVVLEAALEAWLNGLQMTGNQWNIIGGRMYPRKEGFEGLLSSVCKYTAKVSVPEIGKALYEQGGYLRVPVEVQYKLLGAPEDSPNQRFHGTYSVRLNKKNAVAVENIEGKAKRKAYRDLWQVITGTLLPDADDPDETGTVHQVGAHFGEAASADDILGTAGRQQAPAGEGDAAGASAPGGGAQSGGFADYGEDGGGLEGEDSVADSAEDDVDGDEGGGGKPSGLFG